MTEMHGSRRDFRRLVNDLAHRVHGVTHALIVSSDGFPLTASDSVANDDAEQLAAIASGLISLSRSGARLFDKGTCEQIMVRMSRGYFLFMDVGSVAGIAVLTSADCDMKVVAYEVTQFVRTTSHALTAEVCADLRRTLSARRGHA